MLAVTNRQEESWQENSNTELQWAIMAASGQQWWHPRSQHSTGPIKPAKGGTKGQRWFPTGRGLGHKVQWKVTKPYLDMVLAFQRALGKVDRCSLFRLGCLNLQISRQCFAIFVLVRVGQHFCVTLCLGRWSALYSSNPFISACLCSGLVPTHTLCRQLCQTML